MLSRRSFLRFATVGVWVAALASLRSLGGRLVALQPRSRVATVPADFPGDIAFGDGVIVCRTRTGFRVFSARCTHLGCSITRQADGLITCPCHGSQFRLDGTVARGPAVRPLEALSYRVDPKSGAINIQIS